MAERKKYHVTKTDDGWQAKKEGGQRASLTGQTKVEVVKQAVELAKKQDTASVVIHKQDGRIQEERTFPKSSDPFPPNG